MAHMIPHTRTWCRNRTIIPTQLPEGWAFTCDVCQDTGYSNAYGCSAKCGFTIHHECHMPSPAIRHPFVDQIFVFERELPPLVMKSVGIALCFACGMTINGPSYVSMDNRNTVLFLHPCCINLPLHIESIDDEEPAILIAKLNEDHKCQHCQETAIGWAYVSDRDYACHVKCMRWILYDDWFLSRTKKEVNNQIDKCSSSNISSDGVNTLGLPSQLRGSNQLRNHDKLLKYARIAFLVLRLAIGISTGDPFTIISAFTGN